MNTYQKRSDNEYYNIDKKPTVLEGEIKDLAITVYEQNFN